MNKKLIVTLACLMSAQGASALSWPSLPSFSGWFSTNASQDSMWGTATKFVADNLVDPVCNRVDNLVETGQRAAVLTSAPRFAYGFVSSNPYSATGVGIAAGSYPKLIFPILGAGAAAFTLKRHQDFNPDDETNSTPGEKKSAKRKRIAKRVFAGFGGALGTFAFMKKPKMMSVLAIVTGLAYKFKVGPFANNAQANKDVAQKPDGVVCTTDPETGKEICLLPEDDNS